MYIRIFESIILNAQRIFEIQLQLKPTTISKTGYRLYETFSQKLVNFLKCGDFLGQN